MSGIIDVKNDRTNVRRKAATSFKFTRLASGAISDGSAIGSSELDSAAVATEGVSSTGESCDDDDPLFRISVEELLSAGFGPSGVSAEGLVVVAEVDAVGCGVAGACALAAGSAAAAGTRGTRTRAPATFGRMPWALFIC